MMIGTHLINRVGANVIGAYMHTALHLDIAHHGEMPSGAKLIAANHPTTTDPFFLLSIVREPMYLLVTEMAFNDPLLGPMLNAAGHIKVSRENGQAAYREAVDRLNGGSTVGIFPEGALSPENGRLARPRTGAVRMALEAGVPIIPVGIHLDWERIRYVAMTRGEFTETARWYLDGPYAITIGKPIHLTGSIEDHTYVRGASEELATNISRLACEGAARMAASHRAPALSLQ